MMLSEEAKDKIIENNKKISELLDENENIFREYGYNPPENNCAFDCDDRIRFPMRYIRTVEAFNLKYHLREICPDQATRSNIAYTLEVSDLINFIMNRMKIWGPVETIFFKLAIVNFVSIIEAILLEATNNICGNASDCASIKTCDFHFNKEERNNARSAVDKLVEVGILDFNEEKVTRVKEIIDLRNRIHIRLTEGNEMKMGDFNLERYNEVVTLLQEVDKQIYEKAVPHYNCRWLKKS